MVDVGAGLVDVGDVDAGVVADPGVDPGVVAALADSVMVELFVGGNGGGVGVGVGIDADISFRMRSRCPMYHAFTLSSIVAGLPPMRNARSVFLFLAAMVVLRRSIFFFELMRRSILTSYFSSSCDHLASHFSSL